MRTYLKPYFALLVLFASPLYAQTSVSKRDVLGSVTMSGSLIACGYKHEGKLIGQAAIAAFPLVGLDDKSDEVAEAFVKGGTAIQDNKVTCKAVVDYAKRAGIVK